MKRMLLFIRMQSLKQMTPLQKLLNHSKRMLQRVRSMMIHSHTQAKNLSRQEQLVSGKGYGGAVTIALGITNEGEVVGIQILDASNETPGLGQNSTKETWNSQYVGMKSDKTLSVVKDGSGSADNGTVNAISGATITSKAVTRAVNVALKFVAAQTGK